MFKQVYISRLKNYAKCCIAIAILTQL